MRWRPGERFSLDEYLKEQDVEECLHWRHGEEAAFVLYANFGRIIVMISKLDVHV